MGRCPRHVAAPVPGYVILGLQFVRVPCDVEAEVEVAARLGMPEPTPYATELRTAVYRGLQAP